MRQSTMIHDLQWLITGSNIDIFLCLKTYISKSCYFYLMRLTTEASVYILEHEFRLSNLLKFAFYLSENTFHLHNEDFPTIYV
jgi:hypothetical protein